jgi:hypothetical protein
MNDEDEVQYPETKMAEPERASFTAQVEDADSGLTAFVTIDYPTGHGIFAIRALQEVGGDGYVEGIVRAIAATGDLEALALIERLGG